jgi:hypothetical protein
MGRDRSNLEQKLSGNNSVDHPPLQAKPGGAVTLPLARQGFVVKPLYQT